MHNIILPFERWPELEPVFSEFGDTVPVTAEQATFPAVVTDEGQLAAFFHVEHLFHFNSLYVMPEYRDQGFARRLIHSAVARIPPGHSAIWLAPLQKGHHLARALGFRTVGTYQVFRKDA